MTTEQNKYTNFKHKKQQWLGSQPSSGYYAQACQLKMIKVNIKQEMKRVLHPYGLPSPDRSRCSEKIRTDKNTTNEHTLFLISLFTSSLFDHSIFSCNFALFILAYFLLFLTTSFMLLFAALSDVCAFFLLRYFRYNCYFHSHDTLPKNFIIHNF